MLNFPLYIARRYLFSKKSTNVINLITAISMGGIGVGTLSLIVVLSAYNGLENLVESLYNSFDSDIRITVKKGKTFERSQFPEAKIKNLEGVAFYSNVIEETVMLKFGDRQAVATMKAVEPEFRQMTGVDSMMFDGNFLLEYQDQPFTVLGYALAEDLRIQLGNDYSYIEFYAAKRGMKARFNTAEALRKERILPSGVFAINTEFDAEYVLVPFEFGRNLLDYGDAISAVEVDLTNDASPEAIKEELQNLVGDDFEVKTRYEQNAIIYQTNKTEKWITFLILSFILVIATFNLVGSITMLIIDKKDDIQTLASMGADRPVLTRVFWVQGMLIALLGGGSGLVLGMVLILLQSEVGLLPLQDSVVEFYPVALELGDVLAVSATFMTIGLLAAWFPARFITQRYFD